MRPDGVLAWRGRRRSHVSEARRVEQVTRGVETSEVCPEPNPPPKRGDTFLKFQIGHGAGAWALRRGGKVGRGAPYAWRRPPWRPDRPRDGGCGGPAPRRSGPSRIRVTGTAAVGMGRAERRRRRRRSQHDRRSGARAVAAVHAAGSDHKRVPRDQSSTCRALPTDHIPPSRSQASLGHSLPRLILDRSSARTTAAFRRTAPSPARYDAPSATASHRSGRLCSVWPRAPSRPLGGTVGWGTPKKGRPRTLKDHLVPTHTRARAEPQTTTANQRHPTTHPPTHPPPFASRASPAANSPTCSSAVLASCTPRLSGWA